MQIPGEEPEHLDAAQTSAGPTKENLREVVELWGRVHNEMVRAFIARYSVEECARLFEQAMHRLGSQAALARENAGAAEPEEIGREIMRLEENWEIVGSILQSSPRVFEREVTQCPWSHFHPFSCRIFGWYMEGYVKALNPDCAYSLSSMMPKGDATCVWRIQKDAA